MERPWIYECDLASDFCILCAGSWNHDHMTDEKALILFGKHGVLVGHSKPLPIHFVKVRSVCRRHDGAQAYIRACDIDLCRHEHKASAIFVHQTCLQTLDTYRLRDGEPCFSLNDIWCFGTSFLPCVTPEAQDAAWEFRRQVIAHRLVNFDLSKLSEGPLKSLIVQICSLPIELAQMIFARCLNAVMFSPIVVALVSYPLLAEISQSRSKQVSIQATEKLQDVGFCRTDIFGADYICGWERKDAILTSDLKHVRAIYVQRDGIGVRSVKFCREHNWEEHGFEPNPKRWQRVLRYADGREIERISLSKNRLLLRDIQIEDDDLADRNCSLEWQERNPPELQAVYSDAYHPCESYHQCTSHDVCENHNQRVSQMRFLRFDKGCRGVVAAFNGTELYCLETIDSSGVKQDLYQNFPYMFWVYCPLAEGETVTRIWLHTADSLEEFTSLVFQTSSGKVCTAGRSNPLPPTPEDDFTPWDTPLPFSMKLLKDEDQELDGIAVNWQDRPYSLVSVFGTTFDPPALQPDFPPPDLLSLPNFFDRTWWNYSYAWLQDVQCVMACRDLEDRGSIYIGMLFRYANGTEACIGQWRFDKIIEEWEIPQGQSPDIQWEQDEDYDITSLSVGAKPQKLGSTEAVVWLFFEGGSKVFMKSELGSR